MFKELKEIKNVFKLPKKKYYFGKLAFGTPYFYPWNFNQNILSIRKLKIRTNEELDSFYERYPHQKKNAESIYSNIPMCRRSKDWIIKIFNTPFWVQIGWPISIVNYGLGYKDKYETPRYEWSPSFQIYFFKWQFCIFWNAPDDDNDLYYEMILWYLYYSKKDIKKAEETWGWTDYDTKKSTWNSVIWYNI